MCWIQTFPLSHHDNFCIKINRPMTFFRYTDVKQVWIFCGVSFHCPLEQHEDSAGCLVSLRSVKSLIMFNCVYYCITVEYWKFTFLFLGHYTRSKLLINHRCFFQGGSTSPPASSICTIMLLI